MGKQVMARLGEKCHSLPVNGDPHGSTEVVTDLVGEGFAEGVLFVPGPQGCAEQSGTRVSEE